MTKECLIQLFKNAKEKEHRFIAVKIEMPGFPKPEVIVNSSENFEEKLKYYEKAYNDNLELNTFNKIRIVDAVSGFEKNVARMLNSL